MKEDVDRRGSKELIESPLKKPKKKKNMCKY
jgi:hypothetical protein